MQSVVDAEAAFLRLLTIAWLLMSVEIKRLKARVAWLENTTRINFEKLVKEGELSANILTKIVRLLNDPG
jgi:hypothetical protein